MNEQDIWAGHHSMDSWMSSDRWASYLMGIEHILDDRIIRLDDKDPVRRSATSRESDAEFIVEFGKGESSRWIYGKFKKTKIEFSIIIYKNGMDSFGRLRDNCLVFHAPKSMGTEENSNKMYNLFRFTNKNLRTFYAYSDLREIITSARPSGPTLDISRELLGVCWLTYFGPAYRKYFDENLSRLGGLEQDPDGGVTLRLADTPGQVGATARKEVMLRLGSASFATGVGPKEPGQYAITLQALADSVRGITAT